MKPVVCDSCDATFTASELPDGEAWVLVYQCHRKAHLIERQELYLVRNYFQRHPEAENILARTGSQDRRNLMDKLPHETDEDREIVRYLQMGQFSLKGRLAFVEGEIEKLSNKIRSVACPACSKGELTVRSEFNNSFFVGEETTCYWLSSMRMQDGEKIWMRASGFNVQEHWTGYHLVSPEKGDYAFWLWLLSHRANYPAMVDDKELAQIKEDWQNATR